MRRRQWIVGLGVLALAVMLMRHPTADIRVITHDISDPAPRKVEAAVDMGLFALSLLITWTAKGMKTR